MNRSEFDTDSDTPPGEGWLSRWARRKREAGRDAGEDATAPETQPGESGGEPVDLPGDGDMPPLETLDEGSDYSGFMSPKVSDALRRQALRKLFRGGVFNVRDGLDDYDDDFTSFASLGDVITAEMRRQMERIADGNDAADPVRVSSDAGPDPSPPAADPDDPASGKDSGAGPETGLALGRNEGLRLDTESGEGNVDDDRREKPTGA